MHDHPTGPSAATLSTVLDDWVAADPGRRVVAEVIATVVTASSAVATLIAASPTRCRGEDAAAATPTNASGDVQKALDVSAEQLYVAALSGCEVAAVGSEETTDAIPLAPGARLVVTLDPIDGSSNIDINAPIGSIFGVLPAGEFATDPLAALLQPGRNQLAAGIIVYGPSTVMALTWGEGTDIYARDPDAQEFVRIHQHVRLPSDAQEYAINASNARHWAPGIQAYVSDLVTGSLGPRGRDFNMRWLGSLVAETYRILLRGGIFLYPADARRNYRQGRIRLVYEANPVAFLTEQAGGEATDGIAAILDLQPSDLHQRTPLVFGSRNKVKRVRRYVVDPPVNHEESPLFSQRGLFRR